MSAHLMIVAGYMDLPLSHKLTLMKLCDSADDRTRIAYPGLDAVRLWAGTKRSRSLDVLKELQEWGLVMQVKAGHRGRRAEFKVFPEPGDEAFSLAARQKKPCPGVERFAGSPGIPDEQGIADRMAAMDATPGTMQGSGAASGKGPTSRTLPEGSSLSDPLPEGSGPSDPSTAERVQSEPGKGPIQNPIGSDKLDPFGTYLRNNTFQEPSDEPLRGTPAAADDDALIPAPTQKSPAPKGRAKSAAAEPSPHDTQARQIVRDWQEYVEKQQGAPIPARDKQRGFLCLVREYVTPALESGATEKQVKNALAACRRAWPPKGMWQDKLVEARGGRPLGGNDRPGRRQGTVYRQPETAVVPEQPEVAHEDLEAIFGGTAAPHQ